MKALVTGCAGFIGSHLVDRLLQKDLEVIGIDCFTDYYAKKKKESNIEEALKNKRFTFIVQDVGSIDELCEDYLDVDFVFHEAGETGVRDSWGEKFLLYERNNTMITQKLLEFYKDKNIRKFVFASSSSVYGDVGIPTSEETLLKPNSPYGVTKLAAENLCQLYHYNFGVPTISLRYFTVYGPRGRPDSGIYKFIKSLLNEEEITVYGDGTQTRDFTYIDDIVEANMLAAFSRRDLNGEIYNVGSGDNIDVNFLIQKLEQITGKQAIVRYIEKQKGDVKDTLADINKIEDDLDWRPKIYLQLGLSKFVEWFVNKEI